MFLIHYPFLFLKWYYIESSKKIFLITKNFLHFGVSYFSLPLLIKTFFAPWRGYYEEYARGFNIKNFFSAWSTNTISRTFGAVIRFFLIILFVITEVVFLVGGILMWFFWLFLPFLIILVFYQSWIYLIY